MPAYTYEMPEKVTAIAVLINVYAGLEAERVFWSYRYRFHTKLHFARAGKQNESCIC